MRIRLPRPARIALVLGAAAALAGCGRREAQSDANPGVPVTVGVVVRKEVPITISEIGTVEPYTTVAVKAQIGGELVEVAFREGQDVRRGALLFRIDSRPYQAALKSAQAQLDKDLIQLTSAKRDVARYAELVEKDYVTHEEYERILTNAASLEAAVASDRAAVDNATVQLEYCTIRSPIDGRTGKLMVNRGNLVKANDDTPLVVINQIDPIYVAFSVAQQNLPEIKARRDAGRLEVRATVPGGTVQPPPGTLTFIDNAVDGSTGMVLLKATSPNPDRVLWPGQFVTATLLVTTKPNALLVPTEAIQTGQQGPYVYVVKSDLTVESRPLVLGAVHERETIVENGVREGERVVRDGQIRLTPGATVKIMDGPQGTAADTPAAGAPGAAPAAAEPSREAAKSR